MADPPRAQRLPAPRARGARARPRRQRPGPHPAGPTHGADPAPAPAPAVTVAAARCRRRSPSRPPVPATSPSRPQQAPTAARRPAYGYGPPPGWQQPQWQQPTRLGDAAPRARQQRGGGRVHPVAVGRGPALLLRRPEHDPVAGACRSRASSTPGRGARRSTGARPASSAGWPRRASSSGSSRLILSVLATIFWVLFIVLADHRRGLPRELEDSNTGTIAIALVKRPADAPLRSTAHGQSVPQAVPHDRRPDAAAAVGLAGDGGADPLPPRARLHRGLRPGARAG